MSKILDTSYRHIQESNYVLDVPRLKDAFINKTYEIVFRKCDIEFGYS